jgi:hypothetical protein
MNRKEHLLTIAAEECGEVAQRLTKILRFGIFETQPGQDKDNNYRFYQELADLEATVELLEKEGILIYPGEDMMLKWKQKKVENIEHFLEYSKTQGTLK